MNYNLGASGASTRVICGEAKIIAPRTLRFILEAINFRKISIFVIGGGFNA